MILENKKMMKIKGANKRFVRRKGDLISGDLKRKI
jgi:hypothetical protein